MSRKWIRGAHLRRGALHRMLGIPLDRRIPQRVLEKAARAPGLLGRRARAALNLRRLRRR